MKKLFCTLLLLLSLGLGVRAQSNCMCVQLDGFNEYLHTNYNNYSFANFTIELWIKVPTYSTNLHYVSMHHNSYLVLGNYGVGSFSTWADGLNPIDIGPSSMISTTNVWHHVAFTYDGAFQRIYIDGVLDRNIPTTGAVSISGSFAQGLNIGARHDGVQQFVTGLLDEVRIWNIARSQAQIQANMSQALVGNEVGLVNYWPMNDGPGSAIASDLTLNNNDLTLMNMELATDWVSQCPFVSVLPFTMAIAPHDTICAGDTLFLTVSGRDSVIWTPNTFLNVDTGNVVMFFPPASGTLTVVGSRNGFPTPDTLLVNVHVLPSQHVTNTVGICQGDSIFVGGAFQTTAGTYIDPLTNSQGCDSVITTILEVHPNFAVQLHDTICAGDSIFVGGSFQTVAGVYTDNFTSLNGCDSVVTTALALTTVDTSVNIAGLVLTANASPATYVWYDCQAPTTSLGTNQSFTPSVNGQYFVRVTQNGCTAISSCYNVVVIGIADNGLANAVSLYPNPAQDEIMIAFELPNESAVYVLSDGLGREILRGTIQEGIQKTSLSLNRLAKGVYFLKVETDGKSGNFRIVKQ